MCGFQTGTLTEDGLDMYGVIPAKNQFLGSLVTDIKDCSFLQLQEAMASCHSLTFINGVICGDPLDVKVRCRKFFTKYEISSFFEVNSFLITSRQKLRIL